MTTRPTDNLRRQHHELLRIAGDIAAMLTTDRIAVDATAVRLRLSTLSGILNVHLAMEDMLYRALLEHRDARVRDTADRYFQELGGLKKTFGEYLQRWQTPEKIQQAPADFVRASHAILGALSHRINRENEELYPLVDRSPDMHARITPTPLEPTRWPSSIGTASIAANTPVGRPQASAGRAK